MTTLSVRRTALAAFALTLTALFFLLVPLAAPAADPLGCATAPAAADPTPTVCLTNVIVVFDGTSPNNQFVVSWRTLQDEKGQVVLSDGTTYNDVRGTDYKGKTHYVVVSNLDARTNYTLDIVSGGKTYDKNNVHWAVRTGPPIQPGTPYTIVGRVSNPDGSEADGALVYAQLRDGDDLGTQGRSAWLSAVVVVPDGGNFFNLNVEQARTANNVQKYAFNPNGDRVFILASGEQGTASQGFNLTDLHPPAPPPSLILGGSNTGSAVTATATQIPPTFTPTLSPSPTSTITPVSPTPSETPTTIPASETPEPFTETAQGQETQAPAGTTQTAEATGTVVQNTAIAMPAGQEVEPQRTRIFGGVPDVTPPPETNNNSLTLVVLAVVLIVGAALLGLAAFFVTRSKS